MTQIAQRHEQRSQASETFERRRKLIAKLKECTSSRDLERGRDIHKAASQTGDDSNAYVASTLINMYSKCGRMEDARRVFESLEHPNVVSWTALILGYADNGQGEIALHLFSRMGFEGCFTPDPRIFVAGLKACTDLAMKEAKLARGKEIHLLASQSGGDSDMYVQGTLVDMYAKCGSMTDARCVFDAMKDPDVVCWNALILGYAGNGEGKTALDLFSRMGHKNCLPDARTFVAAVKSCTDLADKEERGSSRRGKKLHLLACSNGCDSDIYVQSTLVDMYSKSGNMDDARRVFKTLKHPDLVLWTALILGYADNGEGEKALELLSRMAFEGCAPDARAFVAALKACTQVKFIHEERGKMLHLLVSGNGYDVSDLYIQSTLVDMYVKCGNTKDAQKVVDSLNNPDVVCWTALISGYADNGEGSMALEQFSRMKSEGCVPNCVTYVGVLKACGMVGALEVGKTVHDEILAHDFEPDAILSNALLDFYAKCGNLAQAEQIFGSHPRKNSITWNALMAGYSSNGDTKGVLDLFDRMQSTGFEPDAITFNCILTACSQAGLIDKGQDYFEAMSTKYGIYPAVEHYTCMIDMFGRSNKLDGGMALLRCMPLNPTAVMWTSILGACRRWKNVQLGRLGFESLMLLENRDSGSYVLMANVYGTEELQVLRTLQVWGKAGQSWWASQEGVVHTFAEKL